MKCRKRPAPDDPGSRPRLHPGRRPQQPVKPVIPAAAAKRANASVIGMIIALVVSIAAFLPIVLMNPVPEVRRLPAGHRRQRRGPERRGCGGIHTRRPGYRRHIHVQITPAGSPARGTGVPTWEVGYLTPKEAFIGLVQTRKANPTWLLQQTKNAPVTGTRQAGGQEWELRDTGKGEKSMVLNYRGTTVVLSGERPTGRVRGAGRRRREVPGQ